MASIYALSDPRDPHTFRYVGQTVRAVKTRLADHVRLATALKPSPGRRNTTTANLQWIRQLIGDGYLPVLTVLSEVPDKRRKLAECQWIASLREAGHPLTNSTVGGEGPDEVTPETRARASAAGRRRFAGNDTEREFYRRLMLERAATPEGRAALSAQATKQWSTPGAREAQSARLKEVCARPEVRERRSRAQLASLSGERGDELRAARSVRVSGEQNPASRLTWTQVREIRARYRPRVVSHTMLAEEFGVSPTLIGLIVRGKIWREEGQGATA